jgi:magnesium-transporting ATPase (P-type)
MSSSIITAIVVFVVLIFISRLTLNKGITNLPEEKMEELNQLLSKSRIVTLFIVVSIVLFYFLSSKFRWFTPATNLMIYASALLLFIVVNVIFTREKLKTNHYPQAYIDAYLLSSVIRMVAILLLFGILAIDLF